MGTAMVVMMLLMAVWVSVYGVHGWTMEEDGTAPVDKAEASAVHGVVEVPPPPEGLAGAVEDDGMASGGVMVEGDLSDE